MKHLIFLFISSFLLISCTGIKEKGEIKMENGEGQIITLPYDIPHFGYEKFVSEVSRADFDKIMEIANYEAKKQCQYPLTYTPMRMSVLIDNGIVTTYLDFSAKNGFGVPQEHRTYSKFKGTTLQSTLLGN